MAAPGTADRPELSVVVPVYQEGERVVPVLRSLASAIHVPLELLVVYDFEEDATVPVLHRLGPEIPSLRPLHNTLGRGVLNAMKAGIAEARGDYVLISMADGSDERRWWTAWWSSPAMVRTWSPRAGTCAVATSSAGRSSSGS